MRTCDDCGGTPYYARGRCRRCYDQLRNGPGLPDDRPSAEARFLAKVVQTTSCWNWQACKVQNGYGVFTMGRNKKVLAHRWAYEHWVGPIPEGLHIDHLCNNRACVNPSHLEPVTQAENNRRMGARITECVHGHPYDLKNTYRGVNGHRKCRECRRLDAAEKRHAKLLSR